MKARTSSLGMIDHLTTGADYTDASALPQPATIAAFTLDVKALMTALVSLDSLNHIVLLNFLNFASE